MNRAHPRLGAPEEGGIFAEGKTWPLRFRHPERSEAKGLFSQDVWTERSRSTLSILVKMTAVGYDLLRAESLRRCFAKKHFWTCRTLWASHQGPSTSTRRSHTVSDTPPSPQLRMTDCFYPISFRRGVTAGFTLLEMCMVLLILAILAGVSMPAMQSAFTEHAVRGDAHQLAMMVKTAMIQSAEQHRPYVIDLTTTTMALHPQGTAEADPSTPDSTGATADDTNTSTMADVSLTNQLDPPNELLAPDPDKPDGWMAMPADTEWVFQPGELCPATRVRFKRGEAWLEMSFGALTGNVENEKNYLP
jgi:prepilin-type N-terminal cleavage/methylation domain-containing protein